MITALPGLSAVYEREDGKGIYHRRIVAFDDDGTPLVLTEHGIEPAGALSGYDHLEAAPSPVDAIMPPGGWRVEFTAGDGSTRDEPLVAWGLTGGAVVPLALGPEGAVLDVVNHPGLAGATAYRIYHPDQRESRA